WLGEGGMGVVYEAEHEDIERRVALKILRPEASDDPTLAARFREEARAASRIGSPNIVEIFDFDELPDGRLMIAMELLTGLGLDTELEAGPLAQERVIAVLRQVAKGLAAAHDVGIVHRDVKPDNVILLTEGGRSDYAKLVDFGIATVMTAQDNDAGAGTPHFMAPELILGRSYDGRLDMYALGCMAYELLIGEPPFMMGSVEEILEAQVSLAPRSILEVRPDACHPALEAVILRCLAKDPSERYADMRDLEAALCEAQIAAGLTTPWDDLPLPAVEPERLERLRRLMPRPDDAPRGRRWLWPAIAGLSSTLAALVTFSLFSADPTNEEEAQIKALQDAAHEFGARANWVYPPHDDTRATALLKVIELEAIDGAAEELADERAGSLRQEFADALVELGDLYWDEEGGRPFARDYYAQAYLFDRANDHAYERTGMTLGELADLREKAESGTFSAEDIRAAAALAILAERDAEKRDQLAAAFIEEEPDNPIGRDARFRKITGRSKPRVIAQREAPREPEDELEDAPPATKKVSAPETKSTPESTRPTKDPKKARSLAKDGAAALARGSRRDAESLFHQALESDNSNAAALIGLSDIAFDRSRYSEAIKFAARATRVEPGNGGYRIKL
ncbi:MAG: protein kinase, partial [Myxococcales bacterium]|nr:protein kinase [Myxococcales bacterium]